MDLSARTGSQNRVVAGERQEGDPRERHVGDAAVPRAARAGLALGSRLLAGLDQRLGPHGHKPVGVGEEDGGVAVGDGERARGRGVEVEEWGRGGGGGQDGDGVAGEAEDKVRRAVLRALHLVRELQLARRHHGCPPARVLSGGKLEGLERAERRR